VNLSGHHGHGQGLAVCDELVVLIGSGRIGSGAKGQFQAELAVEVGGCQMTVAQDSFFLQWVLGVDVIADLGLEIRRHLGAAAQQLALGRLVHVAPCEPHGWHLVFGQPKG